MIACWSLSLFLWSRVLQFSWGNGWFRTLTYYASSSLSPLGAFLWVCPWMLLWLSSWSGPICGSPSFCCIYMFLFDWSFSFTCKSDRWDWNKPVLQPLVKLEEMADRFPEVASCRKVFDHVTHPAASSVNPTATTKSSAQPHTPKFQRDPRHRMTRKEALCVRLKLCAHVLACRHTHAHLVPCDRVDGPLLSLLDFISWLRNQSNPIYSVLHPCRVIYAYSNFRII